MYQRKPRCAPVAVEPAAVRCLVLLRWKRTPSSRSDLTWNVLQFRWHSGKNLETRRRLSQLSPKWKSWFSAEENFSIQLLQRLVLFERAKQLLEWRHSDIARANNGPNPVLFTVKEFVLKLAMHLGTQKDGRRTLEKRGWLTMERMDKD